MKRKIIISLLILLTFNISSVYAHDDEKVHPEITKIAIESSSLDDYLKNNLNLTGGVKTKLPSNGKKFIIDWLKEGSTVEDTPMCRAGNHFHYPMNRKSWRTSGMSDEPLWADAVCKEMIFTIEMRK